MGNSILLKFDVISRDEINNTFVGVKYYDRAKTKKRAEGTFKKSMYFDERTRTINIRGYQLYDEGKTYFYDGQLKTSGYFDYENRKFPLKYGTTNIFKDIYIIDMSDIDKLGYQFYSKINDNEYTQITDYTTITYPKMLYYKKTITGRFDDEGNLEGRCKITVGDKIIANGLYRNGTLVKNYEQDNEAGEKAETAQPNAPEYEEGN